MLQMKRVGDQVFSKHLANFQSRLSLKQPSIVQQQRHSEKLEPVKVELKRLFRAESKSVSPKRPVLSEALVSKILKKQSYCLSGAEEKKLQSLVSKGQILFRQRFQGV